MYIYIYTYTYIYIYTYMYILYMYDILYTHNIISQMQKQKVRAHTI